uniref:Uncharacterized protein n=1 Tax=Siphoviridae sp. ctCyS10 TaxID=2825382 RepID=A0A8S5U0R1_9CAUD|nr:MAG TPA: hypothetical protein [Siphoviridae sp. ctCyS10]
MCFFVHFEPPIFKVVPDCNFHSFLSLQCLDNKKTVRDSIRLNYFLIFHFSLISEHEKST